VYIYIQWEREQNCISESEGATGGGRGKQNVREWKILKQSIYICTNIMYCTVSCWVLGEHGDREWISNRGCVLIWLKHNRYRPEVPRQNPLDYQHILKRKWRQGGNGSFLGWVSVGDGWVQGKGEWGEYDRCILHPYMKKEEWNLLKLF
jgi:hypothetical protein